MRSIGTLRRIPAVAVGCRRYRAAYIGPVQLELHTGHPNAARGTRRHHCRSRYRRSTRRRRDRYHRRRHGVAHRYRVASARRADSRRVLRDRLQRVRSIGTLCRIPAVAVGRRRYRAAHVGPVQLELHTGHPNAARGTRRYRCRSRYRRSTRRRGDRYHRRRYGVAYRHRVASARRADSRRVLRDRLQRVRSIGTLRRIPAVAIGRRRYRAAHVRPVQLELHTGHPNAARGIRRYRCRSRYRRSTRRCGDRYHRRRHGVAYRHRVASARRADSRRVLRDRL